MKLCKCGEDAIVVRGGDDSRCHFCNRELRLPLYFEDSNFGVGKKLWGARLSDYRTKFPTDKSLFVFGPAGTGKTHLAVALLSNDICNTPMNEKLDVSFTSMINLLSRIRRTFSKDSAEKEDLVLDYYRNLENLYIDDIGVEQATDWAVTLVYQIIDYRWVNEKRTVFTSNFDLPALAEKLDTRISSRISGMCESIELTGKDRRSSK